MPFLCSKPSSVFTSLKAKRTTCSHPTHFRPPHSVSHTVLHQAVLLPTQGFWTCCSLCLQHCSLQIFIWLPPAPPSGLCLTALYLAEHPVSKVTPPPPSSPPASQLYLSPIGKHLLSYIHVLSRFLFAQWARGFVGSTTPALISMMVLGR